jgi:mannose/fructose/N-acetylgalactosamine-specific phosphotransferase system component IIC
MCHQKWGTALLQAILLTVLACVAMFDALGPKTLMLSRPLLAGTAAGLIVGNAALGMAIGATLELIALGVYTYGGATIPDYQTGAIIGTALAAAGAGGIQAQTAIGIAVGLPAALLLASLDPIGRFLPTFLIHKADAYAMEGNARGLARMHWLGLIPWLLPRAIPTFLAALALNSDTVSRLQNDIPAGLVNGLTFTGGLLPAVGFAMLLTIMPLRRYWYMLLIGFVLFAYLQVPLVGIALFGLPIAIMYVLFSDRGAAAAPATATPQEVPA